MIQNEEKKNDYYLKVSTIEYALSVIKFENCFVEWNKKKKVLGNLFRNKKKVSSIFHK